MKKQMKRIVALMLAATLTVSLVSCGKKTTIKTTEEAIQSAVELQQANQNMELTAPTKYDKDSMVEIAEMLGASDEDVKEMNEDEIIKLVEELLVEAETETNISPSVNTDPGKKPSIEVEENKHYDENGAMTKPFDQIYPELVAEGAVAYDDETLLIKMGNSHKGEVTKAMSEAGVAVLETVVPMEKSTWYEAKLFPGSDAMVAVKLLREMDEIQMVDFNYLVEANGMPDAEAIPEELEITDKTNQQWHLKYCQYPSGHGQLKKQGGDPSVVVAVIDTGVDYDHEDLAQNMWKNTKEIPDNGYDDDGNGYVDDYYGVNVITGYGNGDDDHGHGTHVAGIIAAQNNKIGVVGLAYNVKIMPIKAGMASGYFSQADIAKAIYYAYENGAQVINMSFGGTASSIAVQDALEVAYSRCVLVASAGNDSYVNERIRMTDIPVPNYPAALSYVIGVMSVGQSGIESVFTNYDGALYTKTEYEVYAPGEGILSTIPNNQYASWSGTSMAAPIVSAIAAIVRSEYSDQNLYPTKFIYGQLTSTSSNSAICLDPKAHGDHNVPNIINLYEALTKLPKPDVGLFDYAQFDTPGFDQDTAGKNNGDGVVDAGETIALGLTLRNRWGKAVDTTVTIDAISPTGISDPYIEILNSTVNYGEVGTYSTANSGTIYENDALVAWENPFYIHIKEDCPNDYIFRLNVSITAKNGIDTKDKTTYSSSSKIEFEVRSGTVLPSIIEEDMTLTKDNLWIIPNGTTIMEGATVTVEPGTHIQFWANDPSDPYADQYIASLDVKGRLLVNGTKDEMVYIYPSQLMSDYNSNLYTSENGYISLHYADVTNYALNYSNGYITKADHCIFRQNYVNGVNSRYVSSGNVHSTTVSNVNIRQATDCVFYKVGNYYSSSGMYLYGRFENCIFADCDISADIGTSKTYIDCVFLGNNVDGHINPYPYAVSESDVESYDPSLMFENSSYYLYYNKHTGTTYLEYYVGTAGKADEEIILAKVRELGGDYAVIETEEEKQFINACHYWRIHTLYDEATDTYLWHDGTPIADFMDPDGVRFGYKNVGNTTYDIFMGYGYNDKIEIKEYYSFDYDLYEIPGPVYPEDIGLNGYAVTLGTNNVYQIDATSYPVNDEYIYETTDASVAIVDDNGLVTPVAPGVVDIVVYSWDKGVYNYVTVNVVESVDTVSVNTTEKYQIIPQFSPQTENVIYELTDNTVVTVDENGLVTPVAPGVADIYVRSADNNTYYRVVVTVEDYSETKQIGINEVYQIVPAFSPETENVIFEVEDDTVVTVTEEGFVKPIEKGTTTIKVSDADSTRYYTITMTVGAAIADIYTNQTYQITQQITDEELLYVSEDESVATVDENGLVTPLKVGSTTVNVYIADETTEDITDNQLLFTVEITIKQYYCLEGITLNVTEDVLQVGESGKTTLGFVPSNATDKGTVSLTSSDESVIQIDSCGNYTAVGRGTARIIATSSYGFTAETEIFVCRKTTELSVDKDIMVAALGDEYAELPLINHDYDIDIAEKWTSTDKEVAIVEDGRIKLVGKGTTTLILTDEFSGMKDSCLLYVFDGELSPIVQTQEGDYAISRAENGILYKWNRDMNSSTVEIIGEDVVDFDTNNYYTTAMILANGIVTDIRYYEDWNEDGFLSTDFFKDKKPVRVEVLGESGNCFVLTQEGYVYGWGDNCYGVLGLGHYDYVYTPTILNIEDVKDIAGYYDDKLYILKENGDLYVTGGYEEVAVPTLVATGIIELIEHDSGNVTAVGKNVTYDMSSMRATKWSTDLSDYDILAIDYSSGLATKDGKLYNVQHSRESVYIPTSAAVTALYNGSYGYHVATADGMLYQYDGTNFIPVFTFVLDNEYVKLVSTNINNSVLSDGKLQLDFNKSIKSCNVAVYADDVQIPANVEYQYNTVTISRSKGFVESVNYRVVVNSVIGLANATLAQPIEIVFTVDGTAPMAVAEMGEDIPVEEIAESETVDPDIPDEMEDFIPDEIPDELLGENEEVVYAMIETTVDESVWHETQWNDEVERFYWSIDLFIEALRQTYEVTPIHPHFRGNVILNRVSTDTKPENWLRFVAPSSSTFVSVPFGGNYWGTTNEKLIGKQIVDYSDYNSYARLLWESYLVEAPENTFPFITDVTIYDKNNEETLKVGAEEITVKVTFNRDMDTTIPLNVTFGSSYPYADYVIKGEYVDDRTWQGTYTVSTLIEGGTNYFSIANGMAATDDLMLCEDTARFFFDVDNTAAQALIMQGYATDTGIQLNWTQDDFDTLMGYNVYRSTSEDGYYQRINSTVIPADTKEFFDNTVEPGVQYYYNFTVVQTDMNESVPSGKITIMSKDTMAPDIYHTPVYSAFTGSNLIINATVTDNLSLVSVKAYYRTVGTDVWNVAVMSKLNDKYSAIISANDLSVDGLEYYIEAYDGINYTYKGSSESPYVVTIQQAIDASSLGDVNDDGKITNLDALMLLQAINDKLNLTAEQFKRADLDGNGVLQAFEALRILQYVNGTVGSVVIG